MKSRESLKILLMQIRDDEITMQEELDSFCRYSGLNSNQIDVLNVFHTPNFSKTQIDSYDALFIGGTSDANVLKQDLHPFYPSCFDMIKYCVETEKPVFASCFGFQMAIVAFDGDIKHREENFEMGTPIIKKTSLAKDDPLFSDLPVEFTGISVHRQYADSLPANCINLAQNDYCIHAFKVKDRPFWGFQFHPEVDRETLVKRLKIYQDGYAADESLYEQVISSSKDSPHSHQLVANFISNVLLVN